MTQVLYLARYPRLPGNERYPLLLPATGTGTLRRLRGGMGRGVVPGGHPQGYQDCFDLLIRAESRVPGDTESTHVALQLRGLTAQPTKPHWQPNQPVAMVLRPPH